MTTILTVILFAVAFKSILLGGDFNFWYWFKYGKQYSRWYDNRPKFMPNLSAQSHVTMPDLDGFIEHQKARKPSNQLPSLEEKIGFRPPTQEYRAKVAAYQACLDAGVPIPEALYEYFNHETPDPDGMEVDIDAAVRKYGKEMIDGFDVDLTKLPSGVTRIRFFNSC